MRRALNPRRLFRAAIFVTAALLPAGGRAADPQPYTVTLQPTGQGSLDQALHDSSNLIGLREKSQVGPFALVARARDDASRLQTALNSYGYYSGHIDIQIAGHNLDDTDLPTELGAATGSVDVRVKPVLGPLFHLGQVTLTGDPTQAARDALQLKSGDPAVAANVVDARDRMLHALRVDGHALAKVDAPVATLEPAGDKLDVSYAINAGPRVDIGPITVTGLDRVHESYVRQRLLVHQGELFNPDQVEKARQDLAQLGVFSTVRVSSPDALDPEGQLPISIGVIESPRHVIGFNVAYSTDLGASAGVTFTHRNLFGNAEKLTLGAAVTQLGGGTDAKEPGYNVTAALAFPDVLARDQTVTINLQGIKESLETYDRTAILGGVTVARKLTDQISISAGLQAEQSRILQEEVTRNYTLVGVPLIARYDSTGIEGLLEPTHGIKAAVTVTPTASIAGAGSDFVLLQAAGSTYINLAAPGRSIVALRATVASIQGASTFELPPDQRLYAGGSGTVRGYRYQYVGPKFADFIPTGGTSLAAGTVEFRQRFGESFGAAVFVDAGQVTSTSTPFSGTLRAGAGVGARYFTSIGPIRLDVAVPLDKERGDDSFELYIGLGEAF